MPRALPTRALPFALVLFLAAPGLIVLGGCDLAEDDFRPELVVEGTLTAEGPMATIRLSRTAPVEAAYSFERYALSGATVRVLLLSDEGEVEETFEFYENVDVPGNESSFPGNYVPLSRPKPTVLPNRRYRLEVEVPAAAGLVPPGVLVRAETTVPDTFSIARQPPDSLRYDITAPSPAIDVTPSVRPDGQSVFIFNVRAADPENNPLTPLAASFVENGGVDPEDLVSTSSPLLNEANYERLPDGNLRLRVPWFAIGYYGPNEFRASVLDEALYDFLRSRDAQFNPTTLSPGEIQRVFSNVENGVGVFGSIARSETVSVVIEP